MTLSVNYVQKRQADAFAEKKSLILLRHNLAFHSYFNNRLKPKVFALTDGIRDPDFFDPTWMSSTYAVREIDKIFDKDSQHLYYYKEATINARSPQNEADGFERGFIQRLNQDKNIHTQSGVKEFDGQPYFYTLMRGERMEEACMRCHSTPDRAPSGLTKTYGPARSFNRSVGEVVSAVSVRIPLAQAYSDANRFSIELITVLFSLFVAVYIMQNYLLTRLVLVPVENLKSKAEAIANDTENLGVAIPEVYSHEMNGIAYSFNKMSERIKSVVDGLENTVQQRTADLADKEAYYRLLFQNMTNGFALHEMIFDADGIPSDYRFIEVNSSFEKQTGLNAADIVGKTVLEVMPDTERSWIETYGKVVTSGEPLSFENLSYALGRHYQVWAYCPKPGFFATVISDVTERKRKDAYHIMEQDVLFALSESDSKEDAIKRIITIIRSATEVDAVGIRLQDENDFPYFYQEGFPQDFLKKENSVLRRSRDGGICRDEQGNVCLECTCGLVISGQTDPTNPLFTHGGSFWTNDSCLLLHLTAEDDPRSHARNECIHQGYASVALIPVRAKGKIVGLIQLNDRRKGCFTLEGIEVLEHVAGNIGEAMLRKQAEEEMLRLEHQLHQSQKMESIGSLAGGVAHDFNNKLSVILGCTYLAYNESDLAKTRQLLDEIRHAAEQSSDLTRQLLAFARKQTIAPKVLDLNKTVTGMLKMLGRLIGEDVRLLWRPTVDLWLIKFDPSQLDQILANLCLNARDAIEKDGKIIIDAGNCSIDEEYSRHHPDIRPGEYVRLTVSDNGCGMNPQTTDRIFEPFFTTKETGKGTGLGLATVFGIVKQNDGFIDVCSEIGIGTTFTIYLPRYVGSALPVHNEGSALHTPPGKETILLVEDELAILNMVSTLLAMQGYSVLEASTPSEAIRLAREHGDKVDLLVTDMIMPEMNGKDLANKLRSLNPQLKCLYISGYTADTITQDGILDAGVNFIQKPFSLPDLATKVRDILDGKTWKNEPEV